MSEENLPEIGEDEIVTKVQLTPVDDGVTIADAKALRLTVEGESLIVQAAFQIVMGFLQAGLGGEIARAENSDGEDITEHFTPAVIDPFDLGGDPVA